MRHVCAHVCAHVHERFHRMAFFLFFRLLPSVALSFAIAGCRVCCDRSYLYDTHNHTYAATMLVEAASSGSITIGPISHTSGWLTALFGWPPNGDAPGPIPSAHTQRLLATETVKRSKPPTQTTQPHDGPGWERVHDGPGWERVHDGRERVELRQLPNTHGGTHMWGQPTTGQR